jgi:hypothetical protein
MSSWNHGDFITPDKMNNLENNFSKLLNLINSSSALVQRDQEGKITGYNTKIINSDSNIFRTYGINEEEENKWVEHSTGEGIGIKIGTINKTNGVQDKLEINYSWSLERQGYKGYRPDVTTIMTMSFYLGETLIDTKYYENYKTVYSGANSVFNISNAKLIISNLTLLEQLSNNNLDLKVHYNYKVRNSNRAYAMKITDTFKINQNSFFYQVPDGKYKIQL